MLFHFGLLISCNNCDPEIQRDFNVHGGANESQLMFEFGANNFFSFEFQISLNQRRLLRFTIEFWDFIGISNIKYQISFRFLWLWARIKFRFHTHKIIRIFSHIDGWMNFWGNVLKCIGWRARAHTHRGEKKISPEIVLMGKTRNSLIMQCLIENTKQARNNQRACCDDANNVQIMNLLSG